MFSMILLFCIAHVISVNLTCPHAVFEGLKASSAMNKDIRKAYFMDEPNMNAVVIVLAAFLVCMYFVLYLDHSLHKGVDLAHASTSEITSTTTLCLLRLAMFG